MDIARNWVKVLDSHTGGEPTRLIYAGHPWPWADETAPGQNNAGGSSADDLAVLRATLSQPVSTRRSLVQRREELGRLSDWIRTASLLEPRGSDVVVGAVLTPPEREGSTAGVVFCNNAGYLGMCGHGMIGVVVSLGAMGLLTPGDATIDTPVGSIDVTWSGGSSVTLTNVWSYRHRKDVLVEVPGIGPVTGDIAWGGNWFFLVAEDVHRQSLELSNTPRLLEYSQGIRRALDRQGITGAHGAEIDHVELFGSASSSTADSRNFVLCPGGAYDRSPCGTGTSAKLACLVADGHVPEGGKWRQESIVGSRFVAKALATRQTEHGVEVLPQLTGDAFVTASATLWLDPNDPFQYGIRP